MPLFPGHSAKTSSRLRHAVNAGLVCRSKSHRQPCFFTALTSTMVHSWSPSNHLMVMEPVSQSMPAIVASYLLPAIWIHHVRFRQPVSITREELSNGKKGCNTRSKRDAPPVVAVACFDPSDITNAAHCGCGWFGRGGGCQFTCIEWVAHIFLRSVHVHPF